MSRAHSAGSSEHIAGTAEPPRAGDSPAFFAELYDELKRMAAARMSSERSGHTLQATARVHEAFVRLSEGGNGALRNRRHFSGTASAATFLRVTAV